MAKQRTGTVVLDGSRWYAVVTIPSGPRKGGRAKYRLPAGITEEQARAEAFRLSSDPSEVERLAQLPKRKRHTKKRLEPKLNGKGGRMMRTENGRAVFHQHVVASLIEKTARDVAKGRKRARIYDVKNCDGSDAVVRTCDAMSAVLVGNVPHYIEVECEQ